jgi:hypothetical protein
MAHVEPLLALACTSVFFQTPPLIIILMVATLYAD